MRTDHFLPRTFTSTHYLLAAGVVVLLAFAGLQYLESTRTGAYDALAQCLADRGATFYGAFWCPHCTAQKEMFGNSAELLPYVECSTPDGQAQTAVCAEANITTYPTWVLADGERLSGTQTLAGLAEATECELPE